MSRTQPTLTDFSTVEQADTDESDETRPQWAESTVRCQCGADITHWHSAVAAREIARVYDCGNGVVACPNCTENRGNHSEVETVPQAVRARDTESTAERKNPVTLALKEAKR